MTKKERARRRRMKKRQARRYNALLRLAALMVSLLVAAVVVLLVAPKRSHTVIINQPQAAPEPTSPVITLPPETAAATAEPTAEPTPEPTAVPTPEPTETPAPAYADVPVYKKADTAEKVIAITVDDCNNPTNMQTIARLVHEKRGRMTFFPIGSNLSRPGMRDTLYGCVFNMGFEVENHTWSHSRIFRMPEDEMAAEIWKQHEALNELLGVNYEQHFLRLMGGDGETDQRIHNYLGQLGFKGIAGWSVSGSDSSLDGCKRQLAPGAIYLFHDTDSDTKKLKQFIPYAVSQGYRLVTLNELLGLPDNAVTEYAPQPMPSPRPFADDYRTCRLGDYTWKTARMQDRLRSLGLLVMEGESTGYYGPQTVEAVKAFQQREGLPVTGEADEATQRRLIG